MAALQGPWEAIFIDDGSSDDSAQILNRLAKQHSQLKVIQFRHNEGKAAALQTGFAAAEGAIIITLDADLQDDPQEIATLLAKLNQGYDLVTGFKAERQDPIHKTLPSYFFNATVRKIAGVPLRDINSGLKAYRRPVVETMTLYGELYRFIPILAINRGFKVTEVPVHHRPRQFGQSKYGISRFLRGFLDIFTITFLTRFVKRPLHLFGTLGLIFFTLGFIACVYLSFIHFAFQSSIGDRPLLLFGVLFVIAGIQLISTGLIAELITYYAHRSEPPTARYNSIVAPTGRKRSSPHAHIRNKTP